MLFHIRTEFNFSLSSARPEEITTKGTNLVSPPVLHALYNHFCLGILPVTLLSVLLTTLTSNP